MPSAWRSWTGFPPLERLVDRPSSMPVRKCSPISGRGAVVTGKIEQGTVRPARAKVEILGSGDPIDTVVVTRRRKPSTRSRTRTAKQERRPPRSAG